MLTPTTKYKTATFPLEQRKFDVVGNASQGPAALCDVVLNGISASAGDIFLRLDRLERPSGEFIPELEVLACRHREDIVNATDFDAEMRKAMGARVSTSFFLFMATSRVIVDLGYDGDHLDTASSGPASSTRSTAVRNVVNYVAHA